MGTMNNYTASNFMLGMAYLLFILINGMLWLLLRLHRDNVRDIQTGLHANIAGVNPIRTVSARGQS